MPIQAWFPLAVYVEDIPDAEAHKVQLLAAVASLSGNMEQPTKPTMAWSGDIYGCDQIHNDPQFLWVVQQLEIHTRCYLEGLGFDLSKISLYIQRSWPVVSQPKQQLAVHAHNNAHLSAVYYVDVPKSGTAASGCFILVNEHKVNEPVSGILSENTHVIAKPNPFNSDHAIYVPMEGRLLIFPAKQQHCVGMNQTQRNRVSLSFDIVITGLADQVNVEQREFLPPPPQRWRAFSQS